LNFQHPLRDPATKWFIELADCCCQSLVFILGLIDDSRAPPTGLEVEKLAAKMVNILKHIVKNDAMKKSVALVTAGRANGANICWQ
jgi:hypothetical protein